MKARSGVWVATWDPRRAYLLDPESGAHQAYDDPNQPVGICGGWVESTTSGGLAGWYMHPGSRALMLKAEGEVMPFDEVARATRTWRGHRLVASLAIVRKDGRTLEIENRSWLRAIDSLLPFRDALDELADDFFGNLAELLASWPDQRRLLETCDPAAGPWHLVTEAAN
jgi:hypothetical protein